MPEEQAEVDRLNEAEEVSKGIEYDETVPEDTPNPLPDTKGLNANDERLGVNPLDVQRPQWSAEVGGVFVNDSCTFNRTADGEDYYLGRVRISDLYICKDVPQFKKGTHGKFGEVTGSELTGDWDDLHAGAIAVLKRKDTGRLEVISGRHRLAHAKRMGDKVPDLQCQVFVEGQNFTIEDAKLFDRIDNILNNQATIEEVVTVVKEWGLPEGHPKLEEVKRSKGEGVKGLRIAYGCTQSVIDLWINQGLPGVKIRPDWLVNLAEWTKHVESVEQKDFLQHKGLQYYADGKNDDFVATVIGYYVAKDRLNIAVQQDLVGFEWEDDPDKIADYCAWGIRQLKPRIADYKKHLAKSEAERELERSAGIQKSVEGDVEEKLKALEYYYNMLLNVGYHRFLIEEAMRWDGKTLTKDKRNTVDFVEKAFRYYEEVVRRETMTEEAIAAEKQREEQMIAEQNDDTAEFSFSLIAHMENDADKARVMRFVDEVVASEVKNKTALGAVEYREVTAREIADIKAGLGIDVSGMIHEVPAGSIDYALKKHSNDSAAGQGQIDLTQDDIKLMLDVIDNYDRMEFKPKTVRNKSSVVYVKEYPHGVIYAVEQVIETTLRRSKKPRLVLKTGWKKVAAPNGSMPDTQVVYTPRRRSDGITGEPGDVNVSFSVIGERNNRLIAAHAISHDLFMTDTLGGSPMPSVAITNTGIPFEWGKHDRIVFVGGEDMVNPENGVEVYGADAYSGFFPEKRKGLQWNDSQNKVFAEIERLCRGFDKNRGEEVRKTILLYEEYAQRLLFLKEKGLLGSLVLSGKKSRFKSINRIAEGLIDNNNYSEEFEKFLAREENKPIGKVDILSSNGKVYLADKEGYVEAMKGSKSRGAYTGRGVDSAGYVVAKLAEQFSSIEDIKANRDLLEEDRSWEPANKLIGHIKELSTQYNMPFNNVLNSTQAAVRSLEQITKEHVDEKEREKKQAEFIEQAKDEYIKDIRNAAVNFYNEWQKTSRDYFEAIPQRFVPWSDWKYAVVPYDTKAEVIEKIESYGVKVVFADSLKEGLALIEAQDSTISFSVASGLRENIKQAFNRKLKARDIVPLCSAPDVFGLVGLPVADIVTEARTISKLRNKHGLDVEEIERAIAGFNDPLFVIKEIGGEILLFPGQLAENRSGEQGDIVAPIRLKRDKDGRHYMASLYPIDDVGVIRGKLSEGRLLYSKYNKETLASTSYVSGITPAFRRLVVDQGFNADTKTKADFVNTSFDGRLRQATMFAEMGAPGQMDLFEEAGMSFSVNRWQTYRHFKAVESMPAVEVDMPAAFAGSREEAWAAVVPHYKGLQKLTRDKGYAFVMKDGTKVKVSGRGLRKIEGHSSDRRMIAALGWLDILAESAEFMYSAPNTELKRKPGVAQYHYYLTKAKFEGVDSYVLLTIEEHNNGEFFYDMSALEVERANNIKGSIQELPGTRIPIASRASQGEPDVNRITWIKKYVNNLDQ